MTEELDQQVREALRRRQRSRTVPIFLIMCAVGGSACAYLWVNFGDQVRTAVFGIPPATHVSLHDEKECSLPRRVGTPRFRSGFEPPTSLAPECATDALLPVRVSPLTD